MSKIRFRDLRELYRTKIEREDEWRNALAKAPFDLCKKIEHKLDAPETWTEPVTNRVRRYIEAISLTDKKPQTSAAGLFGDITKRGELLAGVSITLDRESKTHPKHSIHFSIAVRFSDKAVQICRWDAKAMTPLANSHWSSDLDALANEIIAQLKTFLEHDPHEGFEKQIQLGFVRDEPPILH
jgi:hypothetical protein